MKYKNTVVCFLGVWLISGCANLDWQPERPGVAYISERSTDIFSQYMPIVVSENPRRDYNQIGHPIAAYNAQGQVDVSISIDEAVVFVDQQKFRTKKSNYINLIYRIHFTQAPFSLLPFSLTTGKNVGLIFIVTLNVEQQPVLLTTVHTCGCYVGVVPTNYLAEELYPKNWDTARQSVFGAELPGVLQYPREKGDLFRPVIYLSNASHRVVHMDVQRRAEIVEQYAHKKIRIAPLKDLEELQLPDGKTVSLFEGKGLRKGYVKGAFKPFEFLFMSWWALDPRIGEDKKYGDSSETGAVFYTSLKPWARRKSDMWNFDRFLEYWGWRL